MGLFSFLKKKKKSRVEATNDLTQALPPQVTPIGRPDHAPQPIAPPQPVEQNPIAAAVEHQTSFPQQVPDAPTVPAAPAIPARSPEEMCEMDPVTMDRDAIRAHLAALYRRHNAAAASLDADLRAEAELMLDAIVACREKYIEAP